MKPDAFIAEVGRYREGLISLEQLKEKYPDYVEVRENSVIFRIGTK
jgi:hypothetical protein